MNNQVQGTTGNEGFAIGALVCGIASLVFWFIFSPVGLILGVVGIVLGVKGRNSAKKGLGTAGMVCGIIGTVLCAIGTLCWICACAAGNAITSGINSLY